MFEIEKWAKDRHSILNSVALNIANISGELFTILDTLQSGRLLHKQLSPPALEEWLSLYKNHKKIWLNLTGLVGEDLQSSIDMIDEIKTIPINDQPQNTTPEEINRFNSAADRQYEDVLADIKENIALSLGARSENNPYGSTSESDGLPHGSETSSESPPYRSDGQSFGSESKSDGHPFGSESGSEGYQYGLDPEFISTLEHSIELKFLVLIWFPCWLWYATSPIKLLRDARKGNLEALYMLLRLDKSVIFDKNISQMLHKDSWNNPSRYEKFIDALKKPLKKKSSIQRVKVFLASYICAFFEMLDCNLTEPEVRSLFDAIAKDFGRGEIDTDLPDAPEAFAKALQRDKPIWKAIFKSDK